MSAIAICEICQMRRDCKKIGAHYICLKCLSVYDDIRIVVLESLTSEQRAQATQIRDGWQIP